MGGFTLSVSHPHPSDLSGLTSKREKMRTYSTHGLNQKHTTCRTILSRNKKIFVEPGKKNAWVEGFRNKSIFQAYKSAREGEGARLCELTFALIRQCLVKTWIRKKGSKENPRSGRTANHLPGLQNAQKRVPAEE